jgi:hypothetical protein
MKIDLFTTSGLPIFFDTDNLEVIADGGYKLEAVSRTVGQLSKVLRFPFEKEPPTEIYRNYLFEQMPEHERQVLAKYNLSYSMVMMPPGIIGSEYAKTMGHYHPPVPGTNLGFPEVYTQLCGTLVLLMQKTAPEKRGDVEEFIRDINQDMSIFWRDSHDCARCHFYCDELLHVTSFFWCGLLH